jgi:menaquinone-dependent protoporphyrinogen oxidase
MNVLVTAASQQGATYGIAEAIGRTLRSRGLETTVAAPEAVADTGSFDAFVIGSAVYMGHWLDEASEFLRRLAPTLDERPTWLFSSGPVGDPRRLLVKKMAVDPLELPELRTLTAARDHQLFAGKLTGHDHTLARRFSLLLLRGVEGGWRDWSAIEAWAREIAQALTDVGVAPCTPVEVAR